MVGAALLALLVGCSPGAVASASGPATGGPTPTAGTTGAAVPTGPTGPTGPDDQQVPTVLATPPAPEQRTTAPVGVDIPDRSIEVPVDPVGVAADGQMEIPPLAERGGWYRYGADPGDPQGTTVIAAHVDSLASGGTGPFVRLAEVQVGDRVQVTLADGTTRGYRVDAVTRFPKTDARWPEVFTRDGPARLALVTCGGTFDRSTRHYSDNVLVTALPEQP